jgi:hypothetical protein
LIGAIILAVFWAAWDRAAVIYALPERMREVEQTVQQTLPEILEQMRQIAKAQRQLNMMTGILKISPNQFTGPAGIYINIYGNAARFSDVNKVKVTNLSRESRPSRDLIVTGTIQNPNQQVLGEIGVRAAAMLGATGKDEITVKIEPVILTK